MVVLVAVGIGVRLTDRVAEGVTEIVDVGVRLAVCEIVGVIPVGVRGGVLVGRVGDSVGVTGFVFIDGPLLLFTKLTAPPIIFATNSMPNTGPCAGVP